MSRLTHRLQAQLQNLQEKNAMLRWHYRALIQTLSHPSLASLGYHFVPGETGSSSDWVLRQTDRSDKGFEWKGQENYDSVGNAVTDCVRDNLRTLCGLEKFQLQASKGACFVSLRPHRPLLLLVCGSSPGGAAGVWGRSLCVNNSLHEGAMYDYIFRAEALGWSVVVADPCTSDDEDSPHLHLLSVYREHVAPSNASCVAVVAHSYGGPNVVHLCKAEADFRQRVSAIVFTDGTALGRNGTMLQEETKGDANLSRFARAAPLAFEPPSAVVVQCLERISMNFVSSALPLGTPVSAAAGIQGTLVGDRSRVVVPAVSAGHDSHPCTTHSATVAAFEFLEKKVAEAEGA